jgi:hypothetical protein
MIKEGVTYNPKTEEFQFNWKQDSPGDLINLKFEPKTYVRKRRGGQTNIKIYYAYKFNNVDNELKDKFTHALKDGMIDKANYELFLQKAVLGFNQIQPINEYDIIIIPESSSPLVYDLALRLKQKAGNVYLAKDALVKNALENIQIDYDSYLKTAKTDEEREKRKKRLDADMRNAIKTGKFKIKGVFGGRRGFFSNFLVFRSEAHREIFNKIANGRVLLVDDQYTTGATTKEMIREILTYVPKELTVFTLLKF